MVECKGRIYIAGQLDQRSRLERGRKVFGRRLPCCVGYDTYPVLSRVSLPDDALGLKEQRTRGDVIIAGHDGQLPDLRITLLEDIEGVNRVLRRCDGPVLHDHAAGTDPVSGQPLRHLSGLGNPFLFCGGPASGADDERLRIFLRAVQNDLKPSGQFRTHRPIRLQLIAEGNDGQLIRLGQTVRQHIVMDRQV